MIPSSNRRHLLHRMEEARRQTQRQLDMIDRQITRRMTALIPSLGRRQSGYRRGKPPDPDAFLERYRASLAALTAERQPEIDALARKLARQDHAIEALRRRLGIEDGRPAGRHACISTTVDHHDAGPARRCGRKPARRSCDDRHPTACGSSREPTPPARRAPATVNGA